MLEIYPDGIRLEPEDGIFRAASPAVCHPFHILLSVPLERADIERIGAREGWRTELSIAGYKGQPPAFRLYGMWVEKRIMIEFVPESMIRRVREPHAVGPARCGDGGYVHGVTRPSIAPSRTRLRALAENARGPLPLIESTSPIA